MTEPRPIRVMIVDDHPVVRDGLKNMLLAFDDLELVGEAGDGRQAVAHCGQAQPDVILMDMAMPGMDGIAATRAILKERPRMKIIMLTSFVEDKRRADCAGSRRSPATCSRTCPSIRWPTPFARSMPGNRCCPLRRPPR